ncbi:COMM domain-containing protein 7 [Trichoplax sp. H2]|uniref:COMM domain-containing protein n=1 Tax=Trichoplax adhaerens TaxID=10228 RepID=B3RUE7_TRIAD|nr:expressed hypothetical protein [Trichoplax adhaerens]EDV25799.1 expressed hypothetical protein [Trichoplax adhaerens]RDD46110.1 COMM domain-containing protein 7 [Trichoplax sp. H2]|eukprot:XP_002111832.1 expressed hypothetical protein [Trichoplax adhaerens]
MKLLHYTSEKPDDQLVNDIGSLNKFNDELFNQLQEIVFAFLTEAQQSARLLARLEEFAEINGINVNALKNIIRSFLTFCRLAMKNNMNGNQVFEDLSELGLSEVKAKFVAKQWKSNLVALFRSQVDQTLMVNQLVDMEWRFGVTAASNDLEKAGSTFLQLKLVINKGDSNQDVYMELSLPQFYSFLHEMEKAKATLDYFS